VARHAVAVAAKGLAGALAAVVLGLAGCAEAERPTTTDEGVPPTERLGDEALPSELRAFLERAEVGQDAAFTGTWAVTNNLGGGTASVEVATDPPAVRIAAADLVIVDGPRPATCLVSAGACVGEVREQQLAPLGIFSGFFSSGPAQALRTAARRPGAGEPVATTRSVAGIDVDCLAIPVGGVTTATSCLTPEGIFGWVDTPSVHYELTRYAPGRSAQTLDPPYPVEGDGSFLLDPG